MNETKNYDILILGGGLSGLFAAVRAAECGAGSIGIFEAGVALGGAGMTFAMVSGYLAGEAAAHA